MKRLKSNFIYDAIYQILIMIIPIITTPYIARVVGVTGMGIYSYTYSIVCYFMMFALLGMNHYGNREVSKVKDDKEKLNYVFSSIYILQLLITGIVTVIYLLYVFLFSKEYFSFQLVQIIYVLSVALDINWFFCGMQEFKLTVTRSAVIKLLTFVSILLFVKKEDDLILYIIILSMSTFLNQLVLWPFIKGRVKLVKVDRKDIFKHIKPTIILFLPVIATSIYKVMCKIMLGGMISVEEVAYYENAEKILNVILSLVSVLCTVTLPEMTYLYQKKEYQQYYKIFSKSIEAIFFLVFPAIFGLLAVGKPLVLLYLGNDFSSSVLLLKILSISLIFNSLSSIIRMQLFIPRGKDKEYIISIFGGAVVNFVLNLILIKILGGAGAAISTVISEFVMFVFHYYYARQEFNFKQVSKNMVRFFVTSFIMFIAIVLIGYGLNNLLIKLFIEVLVGIVIYFALNINFIKKYINFGILRKKR